MSQCRHTTKARCNPSPSPSSLHQEQSCSWPRIFPPITSAFFLFLLMSEVNKQGSHILSEGPLPSPIPLALPLHITGKARLISSHHLGKVEAGYPALGECLAD